MANDLVFHAAALTCAYLTYREDKRFLRKNPEFFKDLAGRVVLATLSAPHTQHRDLNFRFVETEENFHENEKQLSSYLYLSYIPTRRSLLDQIQANSILESTPMEVKKLYQIMTSEPLIHLEQKEFSEYLLIVGKNQNFAIYIPYLKIAFAIELIVILSKYYGNISFSRLYQTINFLDKEKIETCLITIFKYLHYHVKIDHNTQCIIFPHQISSPISTRSSNPDNLDSSDLKLSQLKHIHLQLSKCIINSNNNELIQAYQSIKNNTKGMFVNVEKNLSRIFAKRRTELENLQSQLEQRKRNLHFQFQNDSVVTPYPKPDTSVQAFPNGEKSTETAETAPNDTYLENIPSKIGIKTASIVEKPNPVVVKPKVEEKPKDPNRYKQNEKSLDFIFRAQRQKEISLLSQNQKDGTHILSEKWCESERNRVTIARDLYTEKIMLRDRFSVMNSDISSLRDEIMNNRIQASQESISLQNMFDYAVQILMDERQKMRKTKRKQTNKKNNPKTQSKPLQNRQQETVNTPKVAKKLQPESDTPQQRNTENTQVPTAADVPGVYVPPHRKNKGKQP